MQIKDSNADKTSQGMRSHEDQLIVDLFALLLEWHMEEQKQKDLKDEKK